MSDPSSATFGAIPAAPTADAGATSSDQVSSAPSTEVAAPVSTTGPQADQQDATATNPSSHPGLNGLAEITATSETPLTAAEPKVSSEAPASAITAPELPTSTTAADVQTIVAQPPAPTQPGQSSSSAAAEADPAMGTNNPYEPNEEASVGAAPVEPKREPLLADLVSGQVDGAAALAEQPSVAAVEPAQEAIVSPVEVNGQAIGAPTDTPASDAPSLVTAPTESLGVPTAPAESVPADEDVKMSEAAPLSSSAAGELSAGETQSHPPPASTEEPPAKRVKTDADSIVAADPSAISFTAAQIKFAQNSIKSLKSRPEAPAFLQPVDPIALNIPQYRQVIEQPMDLGTVDVKLAITASAMKGGKPTEKTKQASTWGLDTSKDFYLDVEAWEYDVRLVFGNCLRFNGPDHPVSQSAKALEAVFEKQLKTLPVEPPPQPETPVEDRTPRRPSNPVPTIRRSSVDAGGRPKREIHAPPPKDLPYGDEPQSASSGRKRKSSKAMTPREAAYYKKVNAEDLKFCSKTLDELQKGAVYQISWPFIELPDSSMDFAPAYYATIKRPISLHQIQDKLRKREYEDAHDFTADVKLMLKNCYTFNQPDSDVYVMGRKLEDVFNDKMKKMPKHKSLTPEPEEEDEDEDAEGEDEEDPLERRIRELEEELATLRAEQRAAKAGKASAPKKKARASTSDGAAKKKASKPRASGDGATPKKAKKPKKVYAEDGSDEEEDVRVVTYEQKEELAKKIVTLTDERLDGALAIINEDKKQGSGDDDEEIELDIDDLSPRTLYKLYRFVVKPKKKPGPKPGTAKGKSSKAPGGKKRKNLDEEEEAARIARLQEQLQSFEKGNEAVSTPAASVPGVGGHDDLVHSDSSSGEEDSDGSESDY